MNYYSVIAIHVDGRNPDSLDWEIMSTVRDMALAQQLFDPAMYAASAGKLTHARAIEMPVQDNMVLDLCTNKLVYGVGSVNTEDPFRGVVVPNHRYLVITRLSDDDYELALCKGYQIPQAVPGFLVQFTDRDPSYMD